MSSGNGRPNPAPLLTQARHGSQSSLGRLLELYRNYLHLIARTQLDLHLPGCASPSDVVQETFFEACRDFAQFRGSTEPELLAWLRRILLHNVARLVEKQLKAQKRDVRRELSLDQRMAALEESSAKAEAAFVSQCSSPSAQVQRRELSAILANHLADLPADYREVIILRNMEGLAFEEVARRMGRTPAAVRKLWLRALDRLRELREWSELR